MSFKYGFASAVVKRVYVVQPFFFFFFFFPINLYRQLTTIVNKIRYMQATDVSENKLTRKKSIYSILRYEYYFIQLDLTVLMPMLGTKLCKHMHTLESTI